MEAYKYFIPLTSRKPKFAFLRQTGSDYFLIFEKVKEKNDAILTKTEKIYSEQKHSGKIHKGYCNFAKLEKACDGYFVVES